MQPPTLRLPTRLLHSRPQRHGRRCGMTPCSIDGCDRARYRRGWCSRHYQRWQAHADPLAGGPYRGEVAATFKQLVTIETDECVLWPHGQQGNGYGQINIGGRIQRTHVLACEYHHGPKPSPKLEVAHSCGVRHCMNGRHLRWATIAENQADRVKHGTDNRGERCASAKLTAPQVIEILASNERGIDLAARFGISQQTISSIRHHRTWLHLGVD